MTLSRSTIVFMEVKYMLEHLTRQERIRSTLTGLYDTNVVATRSIHLKMFPGEVKRFKREFPDLNFDILETSKTTNSKIHVVKIQP